MKYHGLDGPVGETLYAPFPQYPFRNMVLVARTAGDPSQLAGSLPKVVHDIDRDITVGPVRTLDDVVSEAVARQQFRTALFGSLAGLALILAVVGLYGVAAFAVAQRTVEIGVRMALGASAGQVVAMVVRETLWLAATGAGLGVVAALIGTRSLSALLYGVTPSDPVSFLLAAGALFVVAGAAGFLAARRAARGDPIVALRAE